MTAYFIKLPGAELFAPVDKATFVAVERHCGFRNTLGEPDEPGTAGFGSPFADGRVSQTSQPGELLVEIDVENHCAAELEVDYAHVTGSLDRPGARYDANVSGLSARPAGALVAKF